MSMTTQEIMEILPHRHPFLLIDTVEEAGRARGSKEKCNFQ